MGVRSRATAAVVLILVLGACAGCAGSGQPPGASGGSASGSTGPGAPAEPETGPFPSPEQLEELGDSPFPESIFALDVETVDRWALAGPFPEQVGALPRSASDRWETLLEEAARRRAGLLLPTEGMRCAARELGRFYLAHRARPTESLQRFIMARCRVAVGTLGMGWLANDVPEELSDAELFGHWEAAVREMLEKRLGGGPRTAGIWFGREGGHVVVMVASGVRDLRIEPFSPFVAEDGRLEIRGEALLPVSSVSGVVNRGRFGFSRCEPVGEPRLPRFHLACEVDRSDPSTVVSINLHRPDSLIGQTGMTALVWPGERTRDEYQRPDYGHPWPVVGPEEVPSGFAELLNQVRREAGLRSLELDTGQSELAAELAPHFFGALLEQQTATADLIVLGMMAGWYVDGLVQSGHVTSAWVLRSADVTDLLSVALEYPNGRETLLAADVERLAVGPVLAGPKGKQTLAAVFGTYALFSQQAHAGLVERVYARLDAERARRGRGPVERLDEVAPFCHRAASQVQAGEQPADVMSALLRDSADQLRRSVAGWVVEVRDFDAIEFPREYLEDRSLGVAAAVGYRRGEGEPWGRYVVLLVVADPEARGV